MNKSLGRITTGYNGLLLGLESKDNKLIQNAVYDIVEEDGKLVLKHLGEYHYDFNKSYQTLSTTIFMQGENLVATKEESNSVVDFKPCKSKLKSCSNYKKMDTIIGLEFQSKLKRRTDIILENKPEEYKGELDYLTDVLDSTIATNFIHNKSYLMFLRFLKENKNLNIPEDEISTEEMEFLLKDFKDMFEDNKE
jgi:hypothetical protein